MTESFDQEAQRILDEATRIHALLDQQRAAFDDIDAQRAATQARVDHIAAEVSLLETKTRPRRFRPSTALFAIYVAYSAVTLTVGVPSAFFTAYLYLGWVFFAVTAGILHALD